MLPGISELQPRRVSWSDNRYNTTGIGTVTFKRESGSLLLLKDVMFVPGLKKNLISIAVLEDDERNKVSTVSNEPLYAGSP